jgi:c-di-GMP-binding flagellar brake protein YcgR
MGSQSDPLFEATVYATWGVDDPAERLRLLRALGEHRERVTLHAADDEACFVVSRVLDVDLAAGTVDLEFDTDDARRDAFRRAGRAQAVAVLDRVTLQLELERTSIVADGNGGRLRAALPSRLARLQRREAFRVAPPASAVPRLRVAAAGEARAVRILDVSASGIAFEWCPADDGLGAPASGDRLLDCCLELPATAPIRCALRVRVAAPLTDPFDDPSRRSLRVGCAFEGLDAPSARAIQVYVNLAQVRARSVRPRIG